MSKAENTYWTNLHTTQPTKRRTANTRKSLSVNRTTIASLGPKRDSHAPSQRQEHAHSHSRSHYKSHWWTFGVAGSLTLMLCLTINFRALSELNKEVTQNSTLESQIQSVTSENLTLQEEIYYLKNDSRTIEREARKFGLQPPVRK